MQVASSNNNDMEDLTMAAENEKEEKKCCGTCGHYHKTGLSEGCCRRFPPSAVPVQFAQVTQGVTQCNAFMTISPSPKSDWLCGEYKHKDSCDSDRLN